MLDRSSSYLLSTLDESQDCKCGHVVKFRGVSHTVPGALLTVAQAKRKNREKVVSIVQEERDQLPHVAV